MSTALCVAIEGLRDLLEEGVRRARAERRTIVVSHVSPLEGVAPLAAFASSGFSPGRRWFWSAPADEVEVAGIGAACELSADGPGRFDDVARAWELLAEASVAGGEIQRLDRPFCGGPQIFGGFSFRPARAAHHAGGPWSGFPDACFVLPEIMVASAGGRVWLTVNRAVTAHTDPGWEADRAEESLVRLVQDASGAPVKVSTARLAPLSIADDGPDRWKESVRSVVREIERGALEKAVIARSIRVEAPAPYDPARVVQALGEAYPMCYRFAFQLGDKCFAGSTPELLAARQGRTIRSMALAGSGARGRTPGEDLELGDALLSDPKNRAEHAVVADAVRAALEPICEELEMPAEPRLVKLPNVQHLCTPAEGRLRFDLGAFQLARRLHPTPAVGGRPLAHALECIAEHESIDRGWYAGPVGVVDHRQDGAFAVAIRCALLYGNEAHLYAGCGIVAGSDPDVEYEESRLKLMPMLTSLERSAAC